MGVEYKYRGIWFLWSSHAIQRIRQRFNDDDVSLPHDQIIKASSKVEIVCVKDTDTAIGILTVLYNV